MQRDTKIPNLGHICIILVATPYHDLWSVAFTIHGLEGDKRAVAPILPCVTGRQGKADGTASEHYIDRFRHFFLQRALRRELVSQFDEFHKRPS